MRILLFGGTGQVGQAFIAEALKENHQLVLYARSPAKLPKDVLSNPNITLVEGDFNNMKAVNEALSKGSEILISFAGPANPNKGMAVSEFYKRLFQLLPESSIRRCLILSTPAYIAPGEQRGLKWKLVIFMIKTMGGTAYDEMNAMSQATASLPSDRVEWTIFRVPNLINDEAKSVTASPNGEGVFLSRKSLVAWVLKELFERKWIGQAPALSNPGWL